MTEWTQGVIDHEIERLKEVERKAIEQSQEVQTNWLSPIETSALKELVKELVKALKETEENSPVFYIPCGSKKGFDALIQRAREAVE